MADITVIDDESDERSMLGEALSLAGHQVTLAADGNEGLRHIHAHGTDVVVTDLFMPGRDGIETMRLLRNEFPDVVVVAISGNCLARPLLSVATRLGAAAVLQKPFSLREFVSAVDSAAKLHSERVTRKRQQPVQGSC